MVSHGRLAPVVVVRRPPAGQMCVNVRWTARGRGTRLRARRVCGVCRDGPADHWQQELPTDMRRLATVLLVLGVALLLSWLLWIAKSPAPGMTASPATTTGSK